MANSRGNDQDRQNSASNQGGQSQRGFAAMDSDRQREIAAEGGRAAHASGNAHEFTSEEARKAGAKSHGGHGNDGSQGGNQGNQGNQGGAGNTRASSEGGGTRGGSSQQHAEAGRQSHKNDR